MTITRIMIVEDEGIVAKDTQNMLEKFGYSVPAIVSSGDNVVEMVSKTHPDLLLMDIMIEGSVDGIEAASQVRERFDIPIVYLTAYGDDQTLQRARITEPYAYILKPFDSRDLHVAIEIALYKHKMERRLRESERLLSATLRNIADAVIVTDTRGSILLMNPAAECLTGWDERDASGKKLHDVFVIVDNQSRSPFKNLVEKTIQSDIVRCSSGNIVLIGRGNSEKYIDYNASLNRDDKSGILGVVLNFRDITEYKIIEAQIHEYNEDLKRIIEERTIRIKELERQRMENEKLAITGRMAASVAHEINNPLAAIQYAFLLLKDCVPKGHKHYGYMASIEKEIERIAAIVRQMLDMNRPVTAVYQEFDVNIVIRDVVALLRGVSEKHGVSVNYDTCEELLKVNMPEDFLRQVLINIIKNAIDASPEGGEVRIMLRKTDGQVAIMIADKGFGIPEKLQSKIFEPFFSTKSKDSSSGLGLGLSICKGLLDSMGGALRFSSRENEGTVFTIELPGDAIKMLNAK